LRRDVLFLSAHKLLVNRFTHVPRKYLWYVKSGKMWKAFRSSPCDTVKKFKSTVAWVSFSYCSMHFLSKFAVRHQMLCQHFNDCCSLSMIKIEVVFFTTNT
jgi:hypothetical protein